MSSLVELQNIDLHYESTKALKNISLILNSAEIHAIVGERSSGKSSLGHILNGLERPDSGRIIWKGQSYSHLSVRTSQRLGIRTVTQKSSLFPLMSVADNFYIKHKKYWFNFLYNRKKNNFYTRKYLKEHDITISEHTPVKELNLADRYFLDILINVTDPPELLILDEALANLTNHSLNRVIPLLKKLQQNGMSVLFITHRIDDVYDIADNVTIFKNGEILLTEPVSDIDKTNLIRLAYTQISKENNIDDAHREFSQLLKYNEAILEHLPVSMMVVDRNNRLKLINNYAKKYFNVTDSYGFNMPIEELFLPDNKAFGDLILKALDKNTKESFYNVPFILNRETKKNDIITYPIHDGITRIGSVIITNDITEQENFRDQIILSEKLASVGLLAAGVAHEINNPLEIIYSCLDYIKQNLLNKDLNATVDDLTEEIAYISKIVSNLMMFSNKSPNELQYFDVNGLISSMINFLQFSAKENKIRIFFKHSSQSLKISANKIEIKQVFLNIIKNGFEAMPTGGELHICTKYVREMDFDWVEITFRDSGKGIQLEEIKNIFLPFYSTKHKKDNNLGLGLSVTYGIIKKYDGKVSVHNLNGSGTEFIIRFPAVRLSLDR